MTTSAALVAIDLIVGLVFLSLSIVAVQNRHQPGANSAGLLWFVLALLASVLIATRAAVLPADVGIYAVVIGWMVIVPLWAGFVFEYTGLGPSVTRRWISVGAMYVIVAGATTRWTGVLDGIIGQLVRVGTSVLQTALVGVGLFGVFLIVQSTVTYDDLPKAQAIVMAISGTGVSLLLFSLGTVNAADPNTLPPVITGFVGVIAGGFAAGVFRYRLFSDTPGTGPLARQSVLEEMSESVIVVDREQRLVDANTTAEEALGITLAEDAGRPADTVLGYELASIVNETATVPTPTGRRQFDVSRSVLTNQQSETVGTSYLLQDVTDEQTQKQRLEVFNRVLRHNLRNNLDAIRGFAEVLSDETTDDAEEIAERIQGTARDLADLGETVERADRLMIQDTPTPEDTNLKTLVTDVATDISDRYDCHIEVRSHPDDPVIQTDRSVLEMPLREIVENAVEHSNEEAPRVTVVIAKTADGARIAVRDNGPGIPDRERAVLLEGEETPLQHGRGVGLWFVSWAITRLGGRLSFNDVPDSGSEVILTIPDRTERTEEVSR